METLKLLAGASATVLAALIAASITFLVAVFTKDSKISEFRQAWIDALRNDLAQFVGIWYYLANEFQQLKRPADDVAIDELWKAIKPEVKQIEELQTRIELRLNPKEHSDLIKNIHQLAKVDDFIGKPFATWKSAIDQFTAESQKVLKTEWGVVKRGEPTYRWIKRLSFCAILVAVMLFVWLAWASFSGSIATN